MCGAFRLAAALLAIAVLGASPAQAGPRTLLSAEEQAGFAAVGRLNVGGQGHCTATLIAPDLVLTAAHCLLTRTGAVFRAHRLHFLPGWRMGDYAAHLRGAALAMPEGYAEDPRYADDIALIRVAPAEGSAPPPEPMPVAGSRARPGTRVATLSYGRDRAQALSMEADCRLAARRGALIRTDCEAVPGVSGAPLVRRGRDGAELVGVVVAGADAGPVAISPDSLAVQAAAHLPALRARLEAREEER